MMFAFFNVMLALIVCTTYLFFQTTMCPSTSATPSCLGSSSRPHSPDAQSALLYQQLQQLQLHHMASSGSPSSSPTPVNQQRTSPPLLSAGITSGIPVSVGGIKLQPAAGMSTDFSHQLPGGITSGLPVHPGKGMSLLGSITSGLPVVNKDGSPCSGSISSGLPVLTMSSASTGSITTGMPISSRGSSPHMSLQGIDVEPDSIPALSFTQMMQGLQSGSDTPPENFSQLLQTLQSPTRISAGVGGGQSCGFFGDVAGSSSSPVLGHLQNYTQNIQRSSPPSSYLNLQIIREDNGDTVEAGHKMEEIDEEMRDMDDGGDVVDNELHSNTGTQHFGQHQVLTPTSSSELDQYLQESSADKSGCHHPHRHKVVKKRHYAGNPQISITDAHGHVTDVITTDPSDMMEERFESPRNSMTGNTSSVDVSMSNSGSTLTSLQQDQHHHQHHHHHQQQQQRQAYQQQLRQLFHPSWINTNLASIPGVKKAAPSSLAHASLSLASSLPYVTPVPSSLSSRSVQFSSAALSTSAGVGSSARHRSSASRLRRHGGGYHPQHSHHSHHHGQHQHVSPVCDMYSPHSSTAPFYSQTFGYSNPPEPYGPLGFLSLSSHRQYPSGFQAMAIPFLSSRAVSPTCFPQEQGDCPISSTDDFLTTLPHKHSTTILSHSSPSSLVCSPITSPIPIITSSPPSPSRTEALHRRSQSQHGSSSPSPSPPHITSTANVTNLSRPSSPHFPSVGPSPSSSSPTNGCYSPNTSPFPTPANTPRPSICNTDSGHSEMDQDTSPLSDDSINTSSILLEIKTTHRKSVEDVLQAVKAALDSICPQVDYECSETSFRLNGHSDLQMELEVCSEMDGHVPGLQVRKLSGDNLEYAKLCSHLMACVNN